MADRFRTFLSLLGVCIGIFAIVAVFTLVDSLHSTIRDSFREYGTDILFVESQPLEPDLNEDGIFRWWEYVSRPPVQLSEYEFLKSHLSECGGIAFTSQGGGTVGVEGDWRMVIKEGLECGRFFSEAEMSRGADVVILGSKMVEELFPGQRGSHVLGKSMKAGSKNLRIIGVFNETGADRVSTVDVDHSGIIPMRCYERIEGLTASARNSIAVSGASADEIRSLVRQVRRLRPGDADNFAINSLSFIINELDDLFRMVGRLGWIVGFFSLLVGCFGIANIEFVNVEERIPQIGIQRAVGARKRDIAVEYINEAVKLSVGGGVIGIVLVWVLTIIVPVGLISLKLSLSNIFTGLMVSVLTGLAAGVAPALRAARLDPVAAINRK